MKRIHSAILLTVALAAASLSRAALEDALLAHRLLADITEARVLRIERPAGPLFGVVFSFEGSLWLYTAESGTRVLSQASAAFPSAEDLSRMLRRADPSVDRVTAYAQPLTSAMNAEEWELKNACVLAAVFDLMRRLATTDEVRAAGLVLLSDQTAKADFANGVVIDHCLLVFRSADGWQCTDPKSTATFPLRQIDIGKPLDPALVDLAVRERYPLKRARLLMIDASTLRRISESELWRAATRRRHNLQ